MGNSEKSRDKFAPKHGLLEDYAHEGQILKKAEISINPKSIAPAVFYHFYDA